MLESSEDGFRSEKSETFFLGENSTVTVTIFCTVCYETVASELDDVK